MPKMKFYASFYHFLKTVVRPIGILFVILGIFQGCDLLEKPAKARNLEHAVATMDSICKYYCVPNSNYLIEDIYEDGDSVQDKLNRAHLRSEDNLFAHLCPYTGIFSSMNALIRATGQEKYRDILTTKVLPGLNAYLDPQRAPFGYASYVTVEGTNRSDRFYDDNIVLGQYFLDAYVWDRQVEYLNKSKLIWQFVETGIDQKLGGGIYWCEQSKESKNTCANASAAVFAFKLFELTHDSTYFYKGKTIYEWTKKNLQDPADHLYYDAVRLDGTLMGTKYSYNSGNMMNAAVQLFRITKDSTYLTEAKIMAQSCYHYFFSDFKPSERKPFKLLKKGSIRFSAIMLRGYVELYKIDGNRKYIDTYQKDLDWAWEHDRDKNGLFSSDWSGETEDYRKWILAQTSFVEMYATLSTL